MLYLLFQRHLSVVSTDKISTLPHVRKTMMTTILSYNAAMHSEVEGTGTYNLLSDASLTDDIFRRFTGGLTECNQTSGSYTINTVHLHNSQ